MNSMWNELHLDRGKLKEPSYIRDWTAGWKHVFFGVKEQKFALVIYFVLVIVNEILSFFDLNFLEHLVQIVAELTLVVIAYPLIQSAWAELKDKEVGSFDSNQNMVVFKMFLLTITYYFIGIILTLFLIVPGIWFATVFSMAVIVMCVDNSPFVESFTRSKLLVKDNFFQVLRYISLWPSFFVVCFATFFIVLLLGLALLPQTTSDIFIGFISVVAGIFVLFLQLSFFPPMVYMFAYLTDKKLHNS